MSARRRSCGAGLVFITIGLVTGCGTGPAHSAQSFCTYFVQQGSAMHRQQFATSDNGNDILGDFSVLLGASDQFAIFFGNLAKRAPASIEPDVEQLADTFKEQAEHQDDAITNPLGGLAEGLANGLSAEGAYNAVNTYVEQNCRSEFEQARRNGSLD